MLVLPSMTPDWIPPKPDITNTPQTNIEIRHSVNEDSFFSFIFIAGNQGRIVEANDTLTDNLGGFELFLGDLIDSKPTAYLEVCRLGCFDNILIQKIDSHRASIQIYEETDTNKPNMFIEAIVGYKKLVWELYTSYCHIGIREVKGQYESLKDREVNWKQLPEVYNWLGLKCEYDHYNYPDELYGNDPIYTPWSRQI